MNDRDDPGNDPGNDLGTRPGSEYADHPDVDPGSDPDVDPDPVRTERVRELLADAGRDPRATSTPPDVAARLEDVLAGLVAERDAAAPESAPSPVAASQATPEPPVTPESPVTPAAPVTLASRRRQWSPRLAVAAAAVIVTGVGGIAVANFDLLGGSDALTSEDASAGGARTEAESDAGSDPGSDPGASAPSTLPSEKGTAPDAGQRSLAEVSLPRVRSSSYAADVEALLEDLVAPSREGTDAGPGTEEPGDTSLAPLNPACPGPTGDPAGDTDRDPDGVQRLAVLYDGQLTALLAFPPSSGQQRVEAWTCAGDRRLDSARVPTR